MTDAVSTRNANAASMFLYTRQVAKLYQGCVQDFLLECAGLPYRTNDPDLTVEECCTLVQTIFGITKKEQELSYTAMIAAYQGTNDMSRVNYVFGLVLHDIANRQDYATIHDDAVKASAGLLLNIERALARDTKQRLEVDPEYTIKADLLDRQHLDREVSGYLSHLDGRTTGQDLYDSHGGEPWGYAG